MALTVPELRQRPSLAQGILATLVGNMLARDSDPATAARARVYFRRALAAESLPSCLVQQAARGGGAAVASTAGTTASTSQALATRASQILSVTCRDAQTTPYEQQRQRTGLFEPSSSLHPDKHTDAASEITMVRVGSAEVGVLPDDDDNDDVIEDGGSDGGSDGVEPFDGRGDTEENDADAVSLTTSPAALAASSETVEEGNQERIERHAVVAQVIVPVVYDDVCSAPPRHDGNREDAERRHYGRHINDKYHGQSAGQDEYDSHDSRLDGREHSSSRNYRSENRHHDDDDTDHGRESDREPRHRRHRDDRDLGSRHHSKHYSEGSDTERGAGKDGKGTENDIDTKLLAIENPGDVWAPSSSYGKGPSPTVLPPSGAFDAGADAKAVRRAFRFLGTNDNLLIDILCRRTSMQRMQIRECYHRELHRDLLKDVLSDTSGHYGEALSCLVRTPAERAAFLIHKATQGAGTNNMLLIETLCTKEGWEVNDIKQAYLDMYDAHLDDVLESETANDFEKLLRSIAQGTRVDARAVADPRLANKDADTLVHAGEKRLGTDEAKFIEIFTRRSFPQLKLVAQVYSSFSKKGRSLRQAIKRETSGNLQRALLAIHDYAQSSSDFFAQRLQKSMKGVGTRELSLMAIVIDRCEIDMGHIKGRFEELYGKPLAAWIQGDTSFHFRKVLLTLIGET